MRIKSNTILNSVIGLLLLSISILSVYDVKELLEKDIEIKDMEEKNIELKKITEEEIKLFDNCAMLRDKKDYQVTKEQANCLIQISSKLNTAIVSYSAALGLYSWYSMNQNDLEAKKTGKLLTKKVREQLLSDDEINMTKEINSYIQVCKKSFIGRHFICNNISNEDNLSKYLADKTIILEYAFDNPDLEKDLSKWHFNFYKKING